MSTLYKVTTPNGYSTYGDLKWGFGVTHIAAWPDMKPILCTPTVIHAYRSPYQAVLFDFQHTGRLTGEGLLWEAEGEVVIEDATKVGCRSLTTWRTIDPPVLTVEIKYRLASIIGSWTKSKYDIVDRLALLPSAQTIEILKEAFEG